MATDHPQRIQLCDGSAGVLIALARAQKLYVHIRDPRSVALECTKTRAVAFEGRPADALAYLRRRTTT